MFTPIMQRLKSIVDPAISYALYLLLKPMTERYRTAVHSNSISVIKAGGSALAKTGTSVIHYQAKGKNGQIAASTDWPALSGTVSNGAYNIFVLTVNSAGTMSTLMGTAGTTEATVKWPVINPEHAIIGYIKIHVTGTGDFVGGTTALDNATVFSVVATDVQYVLTLGAVYPPARVD